VHGTECLADIVQKRHDVHAACIHGCLKAVYRCNNVMLQDPNPDDPLNKEAAQEMQSNPRQFEYNVKNSIVKGAYINNVFFPPAKDT
jgi:ubiquitin-protein ligase